MLGEGSQVTKLQGQGTQDHTSTHHQDTANQALILPGSCIAQASAYTHTKIHVHILVCAPVHVCVCSCMWTISNVHPSAKGRENKKLKERF